MSASSAEDDKDAKRAAMLMLVERYTKSISAFEAPLTPLKPECAAVLVTGTTGGLGSSLLAALLDSPTVTTVYALNRPSANGEVLGERQRRSFITRGLKETLLDSGKLILLEADLSEPSLGLPSRVLEKV
jgi:hypothetical protein